MFGLGQESGTPIVPIVSSVKLAKISQRLGAAAIVVEGKEAGGHLGTSTSIRELIPDIAKLWIFLLLQQAECFPVKTLLIL